MLTLVAVLLCAAPNLQAEAGRRTDTLISEGFNLTHGFTLDAQPEKTTLRLEFFLPEAGEHTFFFWAESPEGFFSYRLLTPDGQVRQAWSGRTGEVRVTLDAARGKYLLELERAPATAGRAVFGVKGPVVLECKLAADAEHAAAPAKGFQWPYLLYVPSKVRSSRLLVAPNNTGFTTEDVELLRSAGSCELRRQLALADRLGAPVLVPLFPRPARSDDQENLYLHALTRSSLETKVEAYRRVDLQLLAMIDDARAVLKARNVKLAPEVLLWGFSASASFVSRFAMLHPEGVKAVACVSPGGWPIAPKAKLGPDELHYPVGTADLVPLTGHPLDEARLKQIAWLFLLGAQDENDSVVHRDSFSADDEQLITRRFGLTPVARWKEAAQLYKQAGLDAQFKIIPETSHQVSPEMDKDIERFFAKF